MDDPTNSQQQQQQEAESTEGKVVVAQSQDRGDQEAPRKRRKILEVQVEDDVEYFLAQNTQDNDEDDDEDEDEGDDHNGDSDDDDDEWVQPTDEDSEVPASHEQSEIESEDEEDEEDEESDENEIELGSEDHPHDGEEVWEAASSSEDEGNETPPEGQSGEGQGEGPGQEQPAHVNPHAAQVHVALEAMLQEAGAIQQGHALLMQAENQIEQQIATLSHLKARVESSSNAKWFFKERPTRIFPVQTSSNHMQCACNIILPPSEHQHHLFSYYRNQIYCFDLNRKKLVKEFCFELDFYPISLTVNYGLVVAGGDEGEMAILSTHDNTLFRRDLGGSMNNSVEVIFHQGIQKLVVANNDGTVSIFKLPGLEKERVIGPFPDAVNACKMSPDGKYLAVVGDFREVFLIEITEDGFLPPVPLVAAPGVITSVPAAPGQESTVNSEDDENMVHQYPAWNLSSTLLAVTSDTHEYITVWHVPTRSVYARVEAGDYTFPVQFSMMKEDLLVFANRRGFLHLVNIRTMDRQVLAVPKYAKINGFCFSQDFRKLYVALPTRIIEYSMNGPKSLLESCISVIQSQDPPLDIDWKLVPRELLVRIFPYNNLEKGKQPEKSQTTEPGPSTTTTTTSVQEEH